MPAGRERQLNVMRTLSASAPDDVGSKNGVAMRTSGVGLSSPCCRDVRSRKAHWLGSSMDQRTPLEVTTWGRHESFVELAKPVMMRHAHRRLLNRDAIIGSVRCAFHQKRKGHAWSCDDPPGQAMPRSDHSSLHPAFGPPQRRAELTGTTLNDEFAGVDESRIR